MIVLIHVIIALASIGYTTYLFFSPSKSKLKLSYVLVALTLVSGTYLVMSTQTNMVHACVTGLIYFAAVSFAIVLARNKLISKTADIIDRK